MSLRLIVEADLRGTDSWGSGAFGAPRGDRRHAGLDYRAHPGDKCLPLKSGVVTKVGYPYGNDLSYRYVEIEDMGGYRARYFYIEPAVAKGDHVTMLTQLGIVQPLTRRYPGIKDHVHVEVRSPDGELMDPEDYV